MEKRYELVFDDIMIKQLKRAAKNKTIKTILSSMLDTLELDGPGAGELLDSRLHLYEVKSKRPPVRLYYRYRKDTAEIYVFQYEMKTSKQKQKKTIDKLRKKSES